MMDPKSGFVGVFGTGTDASLWFTLHPPDQGWFAFASLGGFLTSDPSAAFDQSGALEVFVRGGDNGLWFITGIPSADTWGSWSTLSGILASGPTAALNQVGHMSVFVGFAQLVLGQGAPLTHRSGAFPPLPASAPSCLPG